MPIGDRIIIFRESKPVAELKDTSRAYKPNAIPTKSTTPAIRCVIDASAEIGQANANKSEGFTFIGL